MNNNYPPKYDFPINQTTSIELIFDTPLKLPDKFNAGAFNYTYRFKVNGIEYSNYFKEKLHKQIESVSKGKGSIIKISATPREWKSPDGKTGIVKDLSVEGALIQEPIQSTPKPIQSPINSNSDKVRGMIRHGLVCAIIQSDPRYFTFLSKETHERIEAWTDYIETGIYSDILAKKIEQAETKEQKEAIEDFLT